MEEGAAKLDPLTYRTNVPSMLSKALGMHDLDQYFTPKGLLHCGWNS